MSSSFLERVRSGELLISDGATGTNLLARGLPRGMPGEAWVLERPDEIVRLLGDFIQAGADILLTCTFGASPLRLAGSEFADRSGEINRRAVALAREAIHDRPLYVGASLGPTGQLLKPFGPLDEQEAIDSYLEQVKALVEAGVDLFAIETQFSLEEAQAALKAIRMTTDLPVVCSFSFDRGTRTMMGVRPAQMASELTPLGVDILGINCGRSLEENLLVLKELRQATDLPIWFKPNAGLPEVDEAGQAHYAVTPEAMGQKVPEWLAAGAQIVGGCCGTTPDHLQRIARQVRSQKN